MNKFVFLAIGLVLGAVAVFLLRDGGGEQKPAPTATDEVCVDSEFIGKVACERPVLDKSEYASLKAQLQLYIKEKEQEGAVSDVGIFFRDLENGPTLGINEYADFSAASLLKIPTLIIYFNLAERNPGLLTQTLSVDKGQDISSFYEQNYPPPERIETGKFYTIEDLLFKAIVYSDNVAIQMLNENLGTLSPGVDIFEETYKELGLMPEVVEGEYDLSVKRYASVYRTLYSATYLNPLMSERALELLAQSSFKNGLVAGLPQDIKVAHKFGERLRMTDDGVETKQLHDCGIVYFPKNPYMLCVMTRGNDYKKLEGVIADVSKMFYEEVQSRKLK